MDKALDLEENETERNYIYVKMVFDVGDNLQHLASKDGYN